MKNVGVLVLPEVSCTFIVELVDATNPLVSFPILPTQDPTGRDMIVHMPSRCVRFVMLVRMRAPKPDSSFVIKEFTINDKPYVGLPYETRTTNFAAERQCHSFPPGRIQSTSSFYYKSTNACRLDNFRSVN